MYYPRVFNVRFLGITAAITAFSVMGGPAAHARSDFHDWDAVAACESGGNWNADTGNGYFGGLQITRSAWRAAGGDGSPAQASRTEQIRVAESVLATHGRGAWPVCGAYL